jgi:hypothetical protein
MGGHLETGTLLSLFSWTILLPILRHGLWTANGSGWRKRGENKAITMYGLSFTASLVCASATRRFASETRCAISSMARVLPGAGEPVAGVGPLETVGEELAVVGGSIETGTLVGTGALIGGVHPNVEDFIAASLAAISARFCAMRSVLDSCENHEAVNRCVQSPKVTLTPGEDVGSSVLVCE